MKTTYRRCWRSAVLGALVCLLLTSGSCRPELRVRMMTRVFHDGSLERRLEIRGWEDDGTSPTEKDWLSSSVGLRLAEPEAWGRVERGPDRLEAEGFFLDADSMPAMLVYSTEEGARNDRVRTQLRVDEKILLRRWAYNEFHGDPFGREETARALDGMLELLADALESELRRQFGDSLDPAPARHMLLTEVRSAALAMISVGRSVPAIDGDPRRAELWTRTLAQHGLPAAPVVHPEEFWEVQTPLLIDWARQRTAEAISTPDLQVSADELLSFWPEPDDPFPRLEEWSQRTWRDSDAIESKLESQFNTIAGYYGRGTAPRFRFEIQVELPGTLLTTNGTPDGQGARWLLRNDDMSLSDFVLRAESVEPVDAALAALGARRQFDTAQLVHLADLLWKRDETGLLGELLAEAVGQGSLNLLRDAAPEGSEGLARELADLLDPDVQRSREPLNNP